MIEVITPTTETELNDVRDLMRAFVAWHRQRHLEDLHLIDRYFDPAGFEDELATLPCKYAAPTGALLLARYDGHPAGCVALRQVDARACEMKRMFVYPRFHGKQVGRALAEAVIECARTSGYDAMVLDTSVRQREAQALYRRYGFRDVPPYYELPEDLRSWLVFMELQL